MGGFNTMEHSTPGPARVYTCHTDVVREMGSSVYFTRLWYDWVSSGLWLGDRYVFQWMTPEMFDGDWDDRHKVSFFDPYQRAFCWHRMRRNVRQMRYHLHTHTRGGVRWIVQPEERHLEDYHMLAPRGFYWGHNTCKYDTRLPDLIEEEDEDSDATDIDSN